MKIAANLILKREAISKFMFNMAFENSIEEGYVTEKPFDALMAGTFPHFFLCRTIFFIQIWYDFLIFFTLSLIYYVTRTDTDRHVYNISDWVMCMS